MQDVFSPSYRHKRSADALARRALARAARLHTVSAQVARPAAELHLPGSVALPAADPCHGAAHSTAVHPDNASSVASSAADPCVHNTVPGGILTTVALQAAELNFSTLVASSAAIASCVDACSGDAHPIGTGLSLSNVMSVASSAADSCPNNSNCMNPSRWWCDISMYSHFAGFGMIPVTEESGKLLFFNSLLFVVIGILVPCRPLLTMRSMTFLRQDAKLAEQAAFDSPVSISHAPAAEVQVQNDTIRDPSCIPGAPPDSSYNSCKLKK